MKKILYLMGVDWHWIRQRPQIIAEMLSNDYDITVAYYSEIFGNISLRQNNDKLEKSIPIPVIPFRDKSRLIHLAQKFIFGYRVKDIRQYDAIWISYPLLYRYIPKSYQGTIVYDCMDNHIALCSDWRIKKLIGKIEADLICRADLVFASSNRLKRRIEKKYQKETILIRNGFVAGQVYPNILLSKSRNINIGYFGTIAEWIDFNSLIRCLDEIEEINFFFWGPISIPRAPQHSRLFYEGIVEHHQLWDKARGMECLIMPFKINNIVKDVDPVKLYEYISMGKIIIAPFYKEIERFEPYVHFYHCEDELLDLLKQLQQHKLKCKYTEIQQISFLEDNTWDNRYETIKKKLMDFI